MFTYDDVEALLEQVRERIMCYDCGGTGNDVIMPDGVCLYCDGSGIYYVERELAQAVYNSLMEIVYGVD